MKNLTLTKEQINSIKYFIREQEKRHHYGTWDKFKVIRLKVHADGYYQFKVHWLWIYDNNREDFYVNGNLFEEFPINAILDGLDVVHFLMAPIRKKAYERLIEYANRELKYLYEDYNFLKDIDYKLGSHLNKENKEIKNL